MNSSKDLASLLDQYLRAVQVKQAESAAQEGEVQDQGDSGTTHPSKAVDNKTQTGSEGSRSAENTADVKKTVTGAPTDAHSESTEDGKSEAPLTTAKPTGEDVPPVGDRPDPEHDTGHGEGKTDHPANVGVGEKYSSIRALANDFAKSANALLAQVAMLQTPVTKKAQVDPTPAPEPTPDPTPVLAPDPDIQSGEQAAKLAAAQLNLQPKEEHVKMAAALSQIVQDAHSYADVLAGFYHGLTKAAEGEDAGPPMPEESADAIAADTEGPPTESEGGGGGGDEGGLQALIQALEAAGITPEDLQQLDPQVLIQALQAAGVNPAELAGPGGPGGPEQSPSIPPEAALAGAGAAPVA